jgi:hypothetical protein
MKKNDTIVENEALPTSVDKELFYYDNCWRVKVFELNPDSTWEDCGTGLAGIIQQAFWLVFFVYPPLFGSHPISQNEVYYIQVTSETDKKELVNSRIVKETDYERQKDTIITWYEEERGKEMALSFQDVEDTKKML